MSFDDICAPALLGIGLGLFFSGIYKFEEFYHAHQISKAKEEFKKNMHRPHFFGDGS